MDRAFAALDRIRTDIDIWWTSGAQATQLLQKGELDMMAAWSTRAHTAIASGAPVGLTLCAIGPLTNAALERMLRRRAAPSKSSRKIGDNRIIRNDGANAEVDVFLATSAEREGQGRQRRSGV